MPKGEADIKKGGSQYKIKYIKKSKPNTKYKKPFLTLNQNPKPK